MSETSFEKDFGFKLNTADAKTLVDAQRKMFGHMLDGMHRIARLAAEHPNDEGFQKGYEAYERLTEYTRKMMLATSMEELEGIFVESKKFTGNYLSDIVTEALTLMQGEMHKGL